MQLSVPSGYLVDDHEIFGDPESGAVMARSFDLQFPDTSASDDQTFIDLERDFRLMLGCLGTDERAQLTYFTSNDITSPLDLYESKTDDSSIAICYTVRRELLDRFRTRVAQESLVRSIARLSISTKLPKFAKEDGRTVKGFKDVFKVIARSFEQRAAFFDLLLRGYGGSSSPLDNEGHYEDLLKFWSPGQARLPRIENPDWLRTIDSLCRFSGLSPRHAPDHGFYLDGFYCGLLVAKTMPRSTWAHTMNAFLALTIPNLRVVVNMRPLAIDAEIQYEAERFSKLSSNIDAKDPDLRAIAGLDVHRDRMRGLISNKVIPFKAQFIVTVCDRSPDGLDAKIEAARVALGKSGFEAFQPSLSTSTVSFFNCATPGVGPWVTYPDYWHKMDDAVNVVNLWPASSTPEGDLKDADWISDGDQNNLIGGKLFSGPLPLHSFWAATTAAGKSSTAQTVAIQTAHMFKLIAVIDDGLSWQTTCSLLDPTCRSIIVRSNSNLTFNCFDTDGLPKSSQHLSSATALCHLIVGQNSDSDKDKLRAAILSDGINEVYDAAYRTWRNRNPEEHFNLCVRAYRILKYQKAQGIDTFLDAFLEFGDIDPDPNDDIDPDDAMDLDRDPVTQHIVQDLAFSTWTPDMFPTLSDLQDELHTSSLQKGPHSDLCATLAVLLRPWLRDGRYGKIIDGASNIDLGSTRVKETDPLKVIHFDLGALGESESELRAVAGFLITNHLRNHIQGMPRGFRKQIILEELSAFLKVPNADQIVVDVFQQLRKYSCQVTAIFQQYSTILAASKLVATAIIGNCSTMMLLRNHNRQDLDTLSGFLPKPGIPEVIKDAICRFPKPSDMKKDDAYAGFVYATLTGEKPRFVVGRNYQSHEVEKITSSSGTDFDEKQKELRKQRIAVVKAA